MQTILSNYEKKDPLLLHRHDSNISTSSNDEHHESHPPTNLVQEFKYSEGLTEAESTRLLAIYGKNELPEKGMLYNPNSLPLLFLFLL